MKKYLVSLVIILALSSCQKDESFHAPQKAKVDSYHTIMTGSSMDNKIDNAWTHHDF